MFFKYIPLINYDFGERDIKQVENLVIAVNPVDDIYDDRFFDNKIIGTESPEEISEQLYNKDPEQYWNLLYVNRVVNPFNDWVKSSAEIEEYCLIKYKTKEEMFKARYFIDLRTGQQLVGVDEDKMHALIDNGEDLPVYIQKITNYEYEQRVNDKKRSIRFVPESRLLAFNDRFETAMRINSGEIR